MSRDIHVLLLNLLKVLLFLDDNVDEECEKFSNSQSSAWSSLGLA